MLQTIQHHHNQKELVQAQQHAKFAAQFYAKYLQVNDFKLHGHTLDIFSDVIQTLYAYSEDPQTKHLEDVQELLAEYSLYATSYFVNIDDFAKKLFTHKHSPQSLAQHISHEQQTYLASKRVTLVNAPTCNKAYFESVFAPHTTSNEMQEDHCNIVCLSAQEFSTLVQRIGLARSLVKKDNVVRLRLGGYNIYKEHIRPTNQGIVTTQTLGLLAKSTP